MSTDMIWQTDSTSSSDTERLGELLGSLIRPPMTVELVGDLGAGKTSLVRGLARGFGSDHTATSPSFSLNNIYETENGKIYHFDLYRLGNDAGDLKEELAEALAESKSIIVVEWGQSIAKLLPAERLSITFENDPKIENSRQVTVKYPEDYLGVIDKLKTLWAAGRP